jgi:hypothetical protein
MEIPGGTFRSWVLHDDRKKEDEEREGRVSQTSRGVKLGQEKVTIVG